MHLSGWSDWQIALRTGSTQLDVANLLQRQGYEAGITRDIRRMRERMTLIEIADAMRLNIETLKRFANPDKTNARFKARMAFLSGELKQKDCEHCGRKKSEMHHPDYTKPLDVIWLCKPCHGREHRRINTSKNKTK